MPPGFNNSLANLNPTIMADLPEEMIAEITRHMSVVDSLFFSCVSKPIRSVILNDKSSYFLGEKYWKPKLAQYFPGYHKQQDKSYGEDFLKQYACVLKKIDSGCINLKCVSDALKEDIEFVLKVVRKKGMALYHFDNNVQSNKAVVLEAVKQNGKALCHAHTFLKMDIEVVLEAVKQNGMALYHARPYFKDNKAVVLEAVKQNEKSIQYAQDELKPFLQAYCNLKQALDRRPVLIVKTVIEQCELLFINNQESTDALLQVLDRTNDFIMRSEDDSAVCNYANFWNQINESASPGLQSLAKLMVGIFVLTARSTSSTHGFFSETQNASGNIMIGERQYSEPPSQKEPLKRKQSDIERASPGFFMPSGVSSKRFKSDEYEDNLSYSSSDYRG